MFDSAAQYKRYSRVPFEEIAQESFVAGIVKDASNTKLHWNLEWLKWHLYMKVGIVNTSGWLTLWLLVLLVQSQGLHVPV